jgi:hypothetical protein
MASVFSGESIGIAFTTTFPKAGCSVQLLYLIICVIMRMSGLFSTAMPAFLQDINYISIARNGARIAAQKEFLPSRVYDCPEVGACLYQNGTDVMKLFGFPTGETDFTLNIIELIVCLVGYRVIAFAIMKWKFR